jgi:hypothetical protein
MTRPKVGESTYVSIVVNCGVLKTFEACRRISEFTPLGLGNAFTTVRFVCVNPGPRIVLLPALPYCPASGNIKASLLYY